MKKQCKIDLLQKEEDVITMMYDTLGQRESQTKQRLHMVRTTTDRGAKPTQQQGRIYQQYAQKYSSCKLYGTTIKDLNTIYDKVNKKNNAKRKRQLIMHSQDKFQICRGRERKRLLIIHKNACSFLAMFYRINERSSIESVLYL